MKYDTVIFDMDGTLLNTVRDLNEADNYALVRAGLPKVTDDETRAYAGNGVRNLMLKSVYGPGFCGQYGDVAGLKDEDIKTDGRTGRKYTVAADGTRYMLPVMLEDFDGILADFKEYYSAHSMVYTKAYDGMNELLEELSKRGCRMAVVSNKFDSAVKELTEKCFPVLKVAIGMQDGIAPKPAPDMVEKAIKELGSSKDRAVYVGDSEVDAATARNSGLFGITCLWGFRSREFLKTQGAKCFVEKPSEILPILENGGDNK